MTASEPPGEQPHGDDTALLTAALNHTWTWYDAQVSRMYQLLNFYIVASAIYITAYTTSINTKHYGVAAVITLAGLGLTVLVAASAFHEVDSATQAGPTLAELQNRTADRLDIASNRLVISQARIRQRRTGLIVNFGFATLVDIGALVYALTL